MSEALTKDASSRNVTIEIINGCRTFCLCDPEAHCVSGHCHSPPSPLIPPNGDEFCNFERSSGKAKGASGLLSYDLWQRGSSTPATKLVIMYSVPLENKFSKNWFGFGIYPTDEKLDDKLFDKMYNDTEDGFVRAEAKGSCLILKGTEVDVMAVMSPLGRSIMKVEVWEKVFNPPMSQGPR